MNAIVAAGITYAVTRACTRGDLIECSCEKTAKLGSKRGGVRISTPNTHLQSGHKSSSTNIETTHNDGEWEWGGCGDNINFGYKKSKECLDARHRRRSDIKTLMKIHNHEAGRLVSYKPGYSSQQVYMETMVYREILRSIHGRLEGNTLEKLSTAKASIESISEL